MIIKTINIISKHKCSYFKCLKSGKPIYFFWCLHTESICSWPKVVNFPEIFLIQTMKSVNTLIIIWSTPASSLIHELNPYSEVLDHWVTRKRWMIINTQKTWTRKQQHSHTLKPTGIIGDTSISINIYKALKATQIINNYSSYWQGKRCLYCQKHINIDLGVRTRNVLKKMKNKSHRTVWAENSVHKIYIFLFLQQGHF